METQMSLYVVGFVVIILLYIYLHLTRNFKYWKNQNVPYEKPILLFGNAFSVCIFQNSIGEFLTNLYNKTSSNIYGFFVFDQPFVLIRDPELIKHILVKDFDNFCDRSVISNGDDDKYGSTLLFSLKNPSWREIRIKISPAFSSGKIKNMTPLIIQASKNLIDHISVKINDKRNFGARNLVMKFSTDVISSCAFGIDANSLINENAEFFIASKKAFELSFSRAVQAVSAFMAPVLFKIFKMRLIEATAIDFMQNAFFETLRAREKSKLYKGDLIDILLKLKHKEPNEKDKFDDNLLVSQAIQFFVAGYETTGSTIFYALYELSKNKDVQTKLRQEIDTVLSKHEILNYDVMQEMPYLDMVISETLRKYPILPYLDRKAKTTYKIPNTDVVIKKDMPVYISLTGLHYDHKYFPDPEKYLPERFSHENKQNIPNDVYMPFGGGLRSCIGARFALITVKLGLVSILSNYEVGICSDSKPIKKIKDNAYGFLLAPSSDINMQFEYKPVTGSKLFKN